MDKFILRSARETDFSAIRVLVRSTNINPTGLKWSRFLIAETPDDGYELVKNSSIGLFLGPGEEIYGVVEEDTEEACYIATMNQ